MRRFSRYLCVAAVIPIFVGALSLNFAGSTMSDSQPNIRVTVKDGRGDDDAAARSYSVVVAGGRAIKFLTGERVPIAVTSSQADTHEATGQITSYSYQNVGFSAKLRAVLRDDGLILVEGEVEQSSIISQRATSRPTIRTRHQAIYVALTSGVPLRLSQVDGGDEETSFLEITAEVIE
jgi:hypothetical protein